MGFELERRGLGERAGPDDAWKHPPGQKDAVLALQRSLGNRAVRDLLQRESRTQDKAAPRTVHGGDHLKVDTVYGTHQVSGDFQVTADGTVTFVLGHERFPVPVGGLTVQGAAERLARCLVDRQLLVAPTVTVVLDGVSASASYKASKTSAQIAREAFMAYVADVEPDDPALVRYVKWLDEHGNSYDLGRVTPVQLWAQSQGSDRESPREKQVASFRQFMLVQLRQDQAVKDPRELVRRQEIMQQFEMWLEKNQGSADFLKRDPGIEYGRIAAAVIIAETRPEVAQDVAKKLEAKRHPPDPATDAERAAKLAEFEEIANSISGYSKRRYPYTIKKTSAHPDILFMGDPAVQRVLDEVAGALMGWAFDHMLDSGFTKVDAKTTADVLLHSEPYYGRLIKAQEQPEEHEYSEAGDDTSTSRTFLEAFGATVLTGLTVVALIGAAVGAEVITAGQATWLLAGMAAYNGIESYQARRDEIEAGGYDVPISETVLTSLGDVVGLAQLIEAMTGVRFGTQVELTDAQRAAEAGEGLGTAFTWATGSKAWEAGETLGMRYRIPRRGAVPAGPNASNTDVPRTNVPMPAEPPPATDDPALRTARDRLRGDLKTGFDLWIQQMRQNPQIPIVEAVKKSSAEKIARTSEGHLRSYLRQIKEARDASYMAARATDDPLRPVLTHNQAVSGTDVTVHFESRPPRAREIQQAVRLAQETGEPVHIFGDTVSLVDYPGIDGTIGAKPRPMQLKEYNDPGHSAGRARWAAEQALEDATTHGYTQVEVYIDMPHRTIAEIKAEWDSGPTDMPASDRRPFYDGNRVAKIRIKGSDGVWRPPKAPKRTGPPPPIRADERDRSKKDKQAQPPSR